MKKAISAVVAFALITAIFAGCSEAPENSGSSFPEEESSSLEEPEEEEEIAPPSIKDAVNIALSDEKITVDGKELGESPINGVTLGGEIVYYRDMDSYESGNPYGEGTDSDKHTAEEAAAHTLLTITKPGVYAVTGKISKGQIAIDLGKDAATDPAAKVTLFLNGVDITCEIAPAIIFYNVYECGDSTLDTKGTVDTSAAGANVVIVDGTENNVNGSYVAKIYKDGGEAKKLAKFDGAFYSAQSMNISAGEQGTGVLNITAENEGINSELHLTVNGGNINITARNDGINTNEDETSVTTINGGNLVINAGLGEEGDGIDSNGYLVINGGKVFAAAKSESGDGGIDAEKGIIINGGAVAAFGGRNDETSPASAQNYMELTFTEAVPAGAKVELKNRGGDIVMEYACDRSFQSLTLSGSELQLDERYGLFVNGVQQGYSVGAGPRGEGGEPPKAASGEKNPLAVPEGFYEWMNSAEGIPEEIREWLENVARKANELSGDKAGGEPPTDPGENSAPQSGEGVGSITLNEFSTKFILTEEVKSFFGVEAAG